MSKPKEIEFKELLPSFFRNSIRTITFDEENLYVGDFTGKVSVAPLSDISINSIKSMKLHSGPIFEVRLKYGLIISCSSDKSVQVTDFKTLTKQKNFLGAMEYVYQTADYKNRLYAFSDTCEVLCWDYNTTKLIKRIKITDKSFSGCIGDGKIFAGGSKGIVSVIDPEINEEIKVYNAHSSSINDIVYRDGLVYTAGSDGDSKIKAWNTTDYKLFRTYSGKKNGIVVIRVKWNYIIAGGNDNKITIFDLETTKILYVVNLAGGCWGLDLNEKMIYAGSGSDLVIVSIENKLETFSDNNLYQFFLDQKFSDFKISNYPVHKFFIKLRCEKEPEEVKIILENNFKKEESYKFLEWVYGKTIYISEIVQKIANKIGIQDEDLKKKALKNDLINAYADEESKDFFLVVKDPEDEDEDEDAYEEIPIHKYILLARCGLFRDFFANITEETNKVHDYSGKSVEVVEQFVRYLYFNDFELTADDDPELIVEELEDAVSYYQLEKHCNLPKCLKKIKRQFNIK
ncbi:f-box/wd repeat-containing protein 1a [Anaeramoeba flamelloides]|uniref:F-box/wd repeat-containing protein 1a n=1 Tax=Anaeramoeba flamelloides TaxID=1746091 RepID=A0ABQ8YYJ8_9EUKA|nr:f-box/wd repeat-containing protein 1a [Anaeramoeba flamelloides]